MLEHSIYSVISPEGCASILWKDADKMKEAAEALRLTAQDLLDPRRHRPHRPRAQGRRPARQARRHRPRRHGDRRAPRRARRPQARRAPQGPPPQVPRHGPEVAGRLTRGSAWPGGPIIGQRPVDTRTVRRRSPWRRRVECVACRRSNRGASAEQARLVLARRGPTRHGQSADCRGHRATSEQAPTFASISRPRHAHPLRPLARPGSNPASRISRSEAVSTTSSTRAMNSATGSPGAIGGRNSTTASPGRR